MSSLNDRELARLVEYAEARPYADMVDAAPPELGAAVDHVGDAHVFTCRALPVILFNRVVGLGIETPATEQSIEACIDVFQRQAITNFAFQQSPQAQPESIPVWLQSHGLPRRDNWVKVYRSPQEDIPTIPTALRVELVGAEYAQTFAEIMYSAFSWIPAMVKTWVAAMHGRPRWRHYMAFEGDQAVATGSLYVENGIGWLGFGATHPDYRKRGAQGAIMAQRIRDARELGCEWVVTDTGEDTPEHPNPSFHNMIRTGFKVAYLRPNYIVGR